MDRRIPLAIMVTILDRGKSEKMVDALSDLGLLFHTVIVGRGTARKKMLSYLNLGETEKDVVISAVPAGAAHQTMRAIADKFNLARPGKGIAFVLPIVRVANSATYNRLRGTVQIGEETEMDKCDYNLIISIVNHGYADDVMDTAREAGAPGGTVVRAHGAGVRQAEKFFGITIHPDKDMLLILAHTSASSVIMDAITAAHSSVKEARAFSFSLPISGIAGLTSLE